MTNKFDEPSKSLAQSVTRRAAFKKFGLGLAGMPLAAAALGVLYWLLPVPAAAQTPFGSSLVLDLAIDGEVADIGPYQFSVSTNGGTLVPDIDSRVASALSLNGTNDYVAIPYDARMYPDEMTVSLWVDLQQVAGTVWRAGDAAADGWRGFSIESIGQRLQYVDFNGGGYNAVVQTGPTDLSIQHWQHIAITRSSNSAEFFVNGIKVNSQTNLTPYAKPQVVPMLLGASYNWDSTLFSFCPMTLERVHIYDRALADNEVQMLYSFEAARPRLHIASTGEAILVWWPTNAAGFVLETSPAPGPNAHWTVFAGPITVVGDENLAVVARPNHACFFRLHKL